MVVSPFRGAVQLGDVPGVDLVRSRGDKLGLDRCGVGCLAAPFPAFAGLAQHPVVGGHRAKVGALVQQDCPDFVRGQVSEPGAVQRVQDRLPLGGGQRPRLDPVRVRDRGRLWLLRAGPVVPVPGGLRHAGRPAGRPGADPGREQGDRLVGYDFGPGSVSALSEIVSKLAI